MRIRRALAVIGSVATGRTSSAQDLDVATVRVRPDGTLDTTFAHQGIARLQLDVWNVAMTVDNDDRVVVSSDERDGVGLVLVRYLAETSQRE